MANTKKLIQAAAGAAGGEGLNVEEVFSTYLYDGKATTQTITNGIDLSGEGGMTWFKRRNGASDHQIFDSERTGRYRIETNTTAAQADEGAVVWTPKATGFSINGDGSAQIYNSSGDDYVSWTFRKAPKFFDVVTYTGDGVSGREIAHNLGTTPGCIIVKTTNVATNWAVYHRGVDATNPEQYGMWLDLTNARASDSTRWNNTAPSSTVFTVGNAYTTNYSGNEYVAYLFAHNDGDGDFGSTADQDIIKCGSFTSDGSSDYDIDLGFEPQLLIIKRASGGTGNWFIQDNMREFTPDRSDILFPNLSNAEGNYVANYIPLSTGFGVRNGVPSGDHIYIAIRRGPMAVPESATEVFNVLKETSATLNQSPPYLQQTGFPVDVVSNKSFGGASSWWTATRLTNARLQLEDTAAETSVSTTHEFDHNDGVAVNGLSGSSNFSGYHWRRAPNFFDVVAYTGNGTAGRTVSHNLGVAPEMIWIKDRDNVKNWPVRVNNDFYRYLNQDAGDGGSTFYSAHWASSDPTDSVFHVGSNDNTNGSGISYIAYLFASLAGVSKVGSYTGNGTSQTIDCGFSSGARFVLIKRTDSTGDWYIWDTERGIVAANDPHLSLNTTAAEVTTDDSIDPVSSGFAVNQVSATNINVSSASYIFYAVS